MRRPKARPKSPPLSQQGVIISKLNVGQKRTVASQLPDIAERHTSTSPVPRIPRKRQRPTLQLSPSVEFSSEDSKGSAGNCAAGRCRRTIAVPERYREGLQSLKQGASRIKQRRGDDANLELVAGQDGLQLMTGIEFNNRNFTRRTVRRRAGRRSFSQEAGTAQHKVPDLTSDHLRLDIDLPTGPQPKRMKGLLITAHAAFNLYEQQRTSAQVTTRQLYWGTTRPRQPPKHRKPTHTAETRPTPPQVHPLNPPAVSPTPPQCLQTPASIAAATHAHSHAVSRAPAPARVPDLANPLLAGLLSQGMLSGQLGGRLAAAQSRSAPLQAQNILAQLGSLPMAPSMAFALAAMQQQQAAQQAAQRATQQAQQQSDGAVKGLQRTQQGSVVSQSMVHQVAQAAAQKAAQQVAQQAQHVAQKVAQQAQHVAHKVGQQVQQGMAQPILGAQQPHRVVAAQPQQLVGSTTLGVHPVAVAAAAGPSAASAPRPITPLVEVPPSIPPHPLPLHASNPSVSRSIPPQPLAAAAQQHQVQLQQLMELVRLGQAGHVQLQQLFGANTQQQVQRLLSLMHVFNIQATQRVGTPGGKAAAAPAAAGAPAALAPPGAPKTVAWGQQMPGDGRLTHVQAALRSWATLREKLGGVGGAVAAGGVVPQGVPVRQVPGQAQN